MLAEQYLNAIQAVSTLEEKHEITHYYEKHKHIELFHVVSRTVLLIFSDKSSLYIKELEDGIETTIIKPEGFMDFIRDYLKEHLDALIAECGNHDIKNIIENLKANLC